jgi:hypothetical protein
MSQIAEIIDKLPPELQKEVTDFALFLLEKQMPVKKKKPEFKWAGALKEMRNDYTSVKLQHEISSLMGSEK